MKKMLPNVMKFQLAVKEVVRSIFKAKDLIGMPMTAAACLKVWRMYIFILTELNELT